MQQDPFSSLREHTKTAAVVGVVFGLVFFGIGATVIGFMWTASGFGAPPLFFRIFATLIAIPFLAMGGAAAYRSIQVLRGQYDPTAIAKGLGNAANRDATEDQSAGAVRYACPACGAPLAEGADVSPHGDVRCAHCGGWFNVHKR
jgi:hypothetical protein